MAAKKSSKSKAKPTSKVKVVTSKSEFIRQNSKLPVKEIITKAAKAGVGDISAAFCYTILSEFRKKQGNAPKAKKTAGEHEVGTGRTTGKASPKPSGTSLSPEAQFGALILRLGTERARELFDSTLAKVEQSLK